MERENYYLLLELPYDPPEEDQGVIDRAIEDKKKAWNKLVNHPSEGTKVQVFRDSIPDIKKVLSDPVTRRQEAKAAKEIIRNKNKLAYERLDQQLKILNLKGSVTAKEISRLANRLSIPEDEIRKRLKIKIVTDRKFSDENKNVKPLPTTTAKQIRSNLDVLGNSSLYDFLEVSTRSSTKLLHDTARNLESDLRKMGKKTGELNIRLELAGQCLQVFRDDDRRKSYDATRDLENYQKLDELLETAGMEKEIKIEEFNELVKQGVSQGLNKAAVRDYIKSYARKKNWYVEGAAKLSVDDLKQCGACLTLNTQEAVNCSNCGFPLQIPCPGCGRPCASQDKNCIICGFPIGDMPMAVTLIRNAENHLHSGEFEEAKKLFKRASTFWPGHERINACLKEIQDLEEKTHQCVKRLNILVSNREMFAARTELSRLRRINPSHPDLKLEKRINDQINAANLKLNQALKAETEKEKTVALQAALKHAVDCKEALSELGKTPPGPPAGLNAELAGLSIKLHWQKSPSDGDIKYRVVRKVGAPPEKPDDGDILIENDLLSHTDLGVKPGIEYYYAVYSIRFQTFSVNRAVTGPIMPVSEVKGLTVKSGDGFIQLEWRRPENVENILVYFKTGGVAPSRSDGEKVLGVQSTGVTHSNLKNEVQYSYRVFAVFKDSMGRMFFSKGETIQAIPRTPPKAIRDLTAKMEGTNIVCRWSKPDRGKVLLYLSQEPIKVMAGEILGQKVLDTLGAPIVSHAVNQTVFKVPYQGRLHILPVTQEGGLMVAGKSVDLVSIQGVSDLRAYIDTGRICLEWKWPEGAERALVNYRFDKFPSSPEDPDSEKMIVTKEKYDIHSALILPNPGDGSYHFTVNLIASDGEKTIYSAAEKAVLNLESPADVRYEIKVSRNIIRKPTSAILVLRSNKYTKLPKLWLVSQNNRIPVKRDHGRRIMVTDEAEIEGGATVQFEIPPSALKKDTYARLFPEGEPYDTLRLILPGKDKLRLY